LEGKAFSSVFIFSCAFEIAFSTISLESFSIFSEISIHSNFFAPSCQRNRTFQRIKFKELSSQVSLITHRLYAEEDGFDREDLDDIIKLINYRVKNLIKPEILTTIRSEEKMQAYLILFANLPFYSTSKRETMFGSFVG
jgi:hypothetical protein